MGEAVKMFKNALILLNLYFGCGLCLYGPLTPGVGSISIVGGEPARIEDFPYLVSLWKKGKLHCGGSILNERYVLTAGHCFLLMDTSQYFILSGTTNISEGGERHDIERITRHDDFNIRGENDICLVKLSTHLTFGTKVAAARLPENDMDFCERTVFNVTGWGKQGYHGEESVILKRTLVPWVDRNTCNRDYRGITVVNDDMFCAGTDGHDACGADSGGPLILHGVVVGIVSRGKSCARKEFPTIYTKVYAYREWIQQNMNE